MQTFLIRSSILAIILVVFIPFSFTSAQDFGSSDFYDDSLDTNETGQPSATFGPPIPPPSSASTTPPDGLGLIPCDGSEAKPCDFNALMTLINKVIGFILFGLALPVAAIMFAYAGFLMVTSGGSAESKGKAKNIFTNAVFGIVIAAGSWLIVKTILTILGFDGSWIGF